MVWSCSAFLNTCAVCTPDLSSTRVTRQRRSLKLYKRRLATRTWSRWALACLLLYWLGAGWRLHPGRVWQSDRRRPAQQSRRAAAAVAQQVPSLQVSWPLAGWLWRSLTFPFAVPWLAHCCSRRTSSSSTCSPRSSTTWRRSSWRTPTWGPRTLSCSRGPASILLLPRSLLLMFLLLSWRRCRHSLKRWWEFLNYKSKGEFPANSLSLKESSGLLNLLKKKRPGRVPENPDRCGLTLILLCKKMTLSK